MTWLIGITLLAGFLLLLGGGEALVRGASRLAVAAGVPPLVVGLTVVAYGTSAPELLVCLAATARGSDDLAVANAIGSNIFNLLFILGLCSVLLPLAISPEVVRREMPVLIGVTGLVLALAHDGVLSRLDGTLLLAGAIVYTVVCVVRGRQEGHGRPETAGLRDEARRGMARHLSLVVLGIALLVVGARLLVESAVSVARGLGVSELVIGLTIVAAGTSLPEVAASVVGAFRGQRDLAVGNVVGSNLFNILLILGASALLAPQGLQVSETARDVDGRVMLLATIACWPLMASSRTLSRLEGSVLFGGYLAYTAWLVLDARKSEALPAYRDALLFYGAPILALVVGLSAIRAIAGLRRRAAG